MTLTTPWPNKVDILSQEVSQVALIHLLTSSNNLVAASNSNSLNLVMVAEGTNLTCCFDYPKPELFDALLYYVVSLSATQYIDHGDTPSHTFSFI